MLQQRIPPSSAVCTSFNQEDGGSQMKVVPVGSGDEPSAGPEVYQALIDIVQSHTDNHPSVTK